MRGPPLFILNGAHAIVCAHLPLEVHVVVLVLVVVEVVVCHAHVYMAQRLTSHMYQSLHFVVSISWDETYNDNRCYILFAEVIRPVRQYNTLLQSKLLEAYHRRNVVVSTSVAVPEGSDLENTFCPMVRNNGG